MLPSEFATILDTFLAATGSCHLLAAATVEGWREGVEIRCRRILLGQAALFEVFLAGGGFHSSVFDGHHVLLHVHWVSLDLGEWSATYLKSAVVAVDC